MGIFIIYVLSVFGLANLYYFQFSRKKKKTRKKTMLRLMLTFSGLILITACILSVVDVDKKIENVGTFFAFLVIGNVMMIVYLLFLLSINNMVDKLIPFVKTYGTYTFVFSLAAFFGIPLLTFFMVYGLQGLFEIWSKYFTITILP